MVEFKSQSWKTSTLHSPLHVQLWNMINYPMFDAWISDAYVSTLLFKVYADQIGKHYLSKSNPSQKTVDPQESYIYSTLPGVYVLDSPLSRWVSRKCQTAKFQISVAKPGGFCDLLWPIHWNSHDVCDASVTSEIPWAQQLLKWVITLVMD